LFVFQSYKTFHVEDATLTQQRISMEILAGVELHARYPVALKRFVAFSKNGNVQEKYLSSL